MAKENGSALAEAPVVATKIEQLLLSKIEESETNPRKTFRGIDELAADIKVRGLLQPILVRPRGARYELVFGARRYRAAKKAGLETIPAMVREMDDVTVLETQLVENQKRDDVHPLEEAEAYSQLLKQPGYDVIRVAEKIKMTASYVYQRLKLADLIPEVKKEFLKGDDGVLRFSYAIELARLHPKDQKETFDWIEDEVSYGNHLTQREIQAHIRNEYHLDLHGAPFKKDDEALVQDAGACTTCPKRTGTVPDLFPEVKKKDTCTDRLCFNDKFQAWMQRELEEIAGRGESGILISSKNAFELKEWGPANGIKVLEFSGYHVPTKKCQAVKVGVHVDGAKVGKQETVCVGASCVGGSSASSAPREKREPNKWELDARRAAKRRALENELSQRILDAVSENLKKPTKEDLILIAKGFYEDVWYERRKKLARRWKLGDGYRSVGAELAKLAEPDLVLFCLDIALSRLSVKETEAVGRRHKVDVGAVRERFELDVKYRQGKLKFKKNTCYRCGCTMTKPCKGGCGWAELQKTKGAGICTACVTDDDKAAKKGGK